MAKEVDDDKYLEEVIKPLDEDELLDKPLMFLLTEIDRLDKISEKAGDWSDYWDYLNELQKQARYRLGVDEEDNVPEWLKENFEETQDTIEKIEGRLNNHRHKFADGNYSAKPEY
jgi:hypothetical protein